MVVATLDDPTQNTNRDASRLRKTFSTRTDMVGKVVVFNGDEFAIEFRKVEGDPLY